jgi:uncharacterized cupin superfamily protein
METNPLILRAEAIAALPGDRKVHFLNSNAVRTNKSLGDCVGLKNLGFHLIDVAPGYESTEYHRHHYEEECVYILSGRGTVTIGTESYAVATGDFIGYPIDGQAHTMLNNGEEPLICIVVGQRLPFDISDYPNQGKRLYRHYGEWDLADLAQLNWVK